MGTTVVDAAQLDMLAKRRSVSEVGSSGFTGASLDVCAGEAGVVADVEGAIAA
jgi:hypothetical protein